MAVLLATASRTACLAGSKIGRPDTGFGIGDGTALVMWALGAARVGAGRLAKASRPSQDPAGLEALSSAVGPYPELLRLE